MRVESWVGAIVLVTVCGSAIGAEQECRRSFLPANVHLVHDIGRSIQRIYERAPSFRAQCERIAAAQELRVTVRIDALIPGRCRAFTVVRRSGRKIVADVHLPPSSDHAELLAHEFEHIIEQIEGRDLRKLARLKGSGVYELEYAVFETDRAQLAGRIVKAETRGVKAPVR